jgi:hypothetical protein
MMRTAWALVALCGVAAGHSMYQSAVLLDFNGNSVEAELQLPVDRLSISFRQTVDLRHFVGQREALRAYILDHVHPVSADSRPFAVSVGSMEIRTVESGLYLVADLKLTPPPGASADAFTLNYDVITHEIVTHVVLVSVRKDSRHLISPDDPILVGIIRGPVKSLKVDRNALPGLSPTPASALPAPHAPQ